RRSPGGTLGHPTGPPHRPGPRRLDPVRGLDGGRDGRLLSGQGHLAPVLHGRPGASDRRRGRRWRARHVAGRASGALAGGGPASVGGGTGGPGGGFGGRPGGGFGGPPGGGFAGGAPPQLPSGAAASAGAGAASAGTARALGGQGTVSAGLISYLRSHQGSAK